ncbi:hypothetical protein ACHAXR_005941 [Thalassiosira sp. AJA248-18]
MNFMNSSMNRAPGKWKESIGAVAHNSPTALLPSCCKHDDMVGHHRHGSCDDMEYCSSISSLSPLCSSKESTQFCIDHIEAGSHSTCYSSHCGDGGGSDRAISRCSPSSSSSDCYIPRSRQLEISRPGNPHPSSSSSSSAPGTRSNPSSSSPPSLIQGLLERSRRHRNRNHPPSNIYLPVIHKWGEDEKLFYGDADPNSDGMSYLMLPPSSFKRDDNNGECMPERILVKEKAQKRQPSSNNLPCKHMSIADYELHYLLQADISSLQTQQQGIQESLTKIDTKARSQRSELFLTLATCGGDAKEKTFVSAVEEMERLRSERSKLVKTSTEVSRVLTRRRDKLEELCILYSLPKPPSNPIPRFTISATPMISKLEGQWFTLTKPTYLDCLGFNDDGNPMYALGRMSFEMFRPGNLVLSIDAVFNPIADVGHDITDQFTVPKNLEEEVRHILEDEAAEDDRKHVLRTYHIVTAFNIEPYCPSFGPSSPNSIVQRPIRGIMTVNGYTLPDPNKPDRLSVWFSGGKMECGESRSSPEFQVWKRIFGNDGDTKSKKKQQPRRRTFREGVMVTAARLLMGAEGYDDGMNEETGEMAYSFSRPVGGHGKAYVDILHLDEQIRQYIQCHERSCRHVVCVHSFRMQEIMTEFNCDVHV